MSDNEKYQDGSHVCLVAKIPEHLASQFPTDSDPDADDPHVTILYIGDLPKEKVGTLINTCKKVFATPTFIPAQLAPEVSYFDPSDSSEGRRVAKIDIECPDLHYFHKRIWGELEDEGIEVAHSHPEYQPHTTLDYIEPDTEYEGPVPSGQWEIDGIEIWGFDAHIRIPFMTVEFIADAVAFRIIAERVVKRYLIGNTKLNELLVDLDRFLTGREPAATSHARNFTHLEVYSEEIYLSDDGYSRMYFDDQKGLFLTSNSRQEVFDQWDSALPFRNAVEQEIRQWVKSFES